MTKTKLIVISVLLGVCLVLNVLLSGRIDRTNAYTAAQTEPNVVSRQALPTLSGLELGNVAEGNRFDLIKHFVYAIVLVGLLGAGAWYVSRKLMPRLATARGRNVAVIENIPLGPNKMLHLIEVGSGRRLLVGSTSQSVSFLADVTACLAETPDAGDEQENAAP
jgi:flagellar biogenesis protein FliO